MHACGHDIHMTVHQGVAEMMVNWGKVQGT